jgi:hypothetical protein
MVGSLRVVPWTLLSEILHSCWTRPDLMSAVKSIEMASCMIILVLYENI